MCVDEQSFDYDDDDDDYNRGSSLCLCACLCEVAIALDNCSLCKCEWRQSELVKDIASAHAARILNVNTSVIASNAYCVFVVKVSCFARMSDEPLHVSVCY